MTRERLRQCGAVLGTVWVPVGGFAALDPCTARCSKIAYITGWRIWSELPTPHRRHVEFNGQGWLRLEPGEAKGVTAEREFTTWMREVLERQREFVSQIERRNES